MIHLYTDASYDEGDCISGWSYVVVKNTNVIARGSGLQTGVNSIDDAEAHAILMGIFHCILTYKLDDLLVIWCDNMGVVRDIQKGGNKYEHIVNYIQKYKNGAFTINFCPRMFNDFAKIVDRNSKQARKNG